MSTKMKKGIFEIGDCGCRRCKQHESEARWAKLQCDFWYRAVGPGHPDSDDLLWLIKEYRERAI